MFFFIDRDFVDDPLMKDVREVTLSYTFLYVVLSSCCRPRGPARPDRRSARLYSCFRLLTFTLTLTAAHDETRTATSSPPKGRSLLPTLYPHPRAVLLPSPPCCNHPSFCLRTELAIQHQVSPLSLHEKSRDDRSLAMRGRSWVSRMITRARPATSSVAS